MKTYQGITRPINEIDIERFPELEPVLAAWRACDCAALDDLESSPFGPFLDDLVLVEAQDEGHYLYRHYGRGISKDAGISMVGKSTDDFASGIGKSYAQIYDTALRSKRVMYSVNRASMTHTAHSWLRVIMPFPAKRGQRPARLVALVKRLVWVEDILRELARDTGFFGGTLEPVLEENHVADLVLLSLTDMDDTLGKRVTHLSDLFGRPLTACEASKVVAAADGETAMRIELPDSMQRFGRRFVLTITGGQYQPIFELVDATDMLDARSEAEDQRETMADFARVASDWLWETDAQHVFTYMSDAVEVVSGYPASFFIGRSCFNYLPLPDNEERFREHRRVMDSAMPFKGFVYRSKTPDGEVRWYRINGSPRFDKQGGFLGYRGAGSDITAEVAAREAAEQRKTVMEDFASLASDWMWETDTDHIFTYMSAAIEDQTGAPPERYIGVNWYDVEDIPENVEGFAAHRALRDARKPFTDFVYKGYCDDGRVMWVRASGRPVFAQDGRFVGYRGTSSNITAEIEAQQALEAQKAALEDFAEIGSDWMWEADADHKLTMLTDAAANVTGYPLSFFIGKSRLGFANLPENKAAFATHVEDLKARRPFRDLTYRIQAADGSFRWFQINGLPRFDQAGAFCGYRGTGSDITGEVEAKRELEAQKTAMEEFAAVASDWKWETDEYHRFQMFSHVIDGFVAEPETFMGKTRFELFDYPENERVFEQHLDDLNAHRPFRNTVYVNKLGDEVSKWIRISGNPRFDNDGRFLGCRGTGTVVTAEVEAQRALAKNRAAMEDFANTASDWLWEVNANEIFTMMSPAIKDFTGKSHESYIGTSILDLIGGLANEDVLKEHLKKIERREAYTDFVYQVSLPDGRTVWARSNGRPFFAEDGTFLGYRGTGTNITEEVEAREQAARRAADLAEAHRLGKLGAWSYRRDTGMMTLSPEFLELTGLPESSRTISGKRFASLVQPEDRETISVSMRKLLATAQNQAVDISWKRKGRQCMDLNVIARARCDAQGRPNEVFGTVQDITERKQAERELEMLAFHDPLTGLGNRAYFTRELNGVLRRVDQKASQAGLLLLDLDHFKEVNDTLGHAAGDELLRRVSERLSHSVSGQGIVCRLGGDEFAVIVPSVSNPSELSAIASGIVSAFAATVQLNDGSVHISTSIGMVLLPEQARDGDEAMRFADLALYEAKAAGRNRALLFHPGLDKDVQDRVSLARDLRDAISNDTLDAHFQLQVDVMEGRVSGFEALVRWNHPTRGDIPPTKFIPIAESSRLIADLGAWMVHKVCRQGNEWLDAGGAPLQMAVNLSVAQLWHRDVESDVQQALKDTGFPPELLCVELTESVFSEDALPRIQKLFANLKELGVQIALDDFGTGYSSLRYLNTLSVDKLKIDRSFVIDCDRDPEKLRLLQGIVGLGRGLGLSLVVEGVETEAELKVICDLGCEEVQGYFFAKPKAFHEACLDAAHTEAQYGFASVMWKDHQGLPGNDDAVPPPMARLSKAG